MNQSAHFNNNEINHQTSGSMQELILSGGARSSNQSNYTSFNSKSLSPTKFHKHNSAISAYGGDMSPDIRA